MRRSKPSNTGSAPENGLRHPPGIHWAERRVWAHIAITFTAFAWLRMLMRRLRQALARAAVRDVEAALVRNDDAGDRLLLPSRPQPLQKANYQLLGLAVYGHPLTSTSFI